MTQLSGINGGDSMAQAINANGDVAGQCNLPGYNIYHACMWENGRVIDLGTLGGVRSSAFGINNSDAVVGVSELSGSQYHAFAWQNGVMTDLGTPGQYSVANGINDSGYVVGELGNGPYRPVIWQPQQH